MMKLTRRRVRLLFPLAVFLTLLIPLTIEFAHAADPPVPTYGAATVDGNTSEWDLNTDFFADMIKAAGLGGQTDVLSKLYLRYDCSTGVLYALVLATAGHTIDADSNSDEHFIKLGQTTKLVDASDRPPDGTLPDFEWVGLSGDGKTADGWEAAVSLAAGDYNNFNVHTNVDNGETSQVLNKGIELSISCACLPTLYFESDPNGNPFSSSQVIDNEYAAWGINVSVTPDDPDDGPAIIFDSSNSSYTWDSDLFTPGSGPGNTVPQGNILVIKEGPSEHGGNQPNDSGDGGTIIFTFDQATRIDEVHILDNEEAGSKVKAYSDTAGNTLLREVDMAQAGDNSFQVVQVNASDARRLEIIFAGSGGVPAVVFCRDSMDFGDLPEPAPGTSIPYPTTHANDGARHLIGDLKLGSTVEADDNGQPRNGADGDDVADSNDDEDGVVRTPGHLWQSGGTGSIDVTVTGGDGCLAGWIDWNNDGDFGDAGEQILTNQLVSEGANSNITFNIPSILLPNTFYARFRLYPRDSGGTCTTTRHPTGAAINGEVEDYFWEFGPTAVTLTRLEARSEAVRDTVPSLLAPAALALVIGGVALGGVLVRRRARSA